MANKMQLCRTVYYSIVPWLLNMFRAILSLIIRSFIHLVVCLTTGPKPLPKRALHIVRSRASYFKWEYPLLSLRSSNSFIRLLPCLPIISIPPCIFPSVTRCRRQFRRKMWPIQELINCNYNFWFYSRLSLPTAVSCHDITGTAWRSGINRCHYFEGTYSVHFDT